MQVFFKVFKECASLVGAAPSITLNFVWGDLSPRVIAIHAFFRVKVQLYNAKFVFTRNR